MPGMMLRYLSLISICLLTGCATYTYEGRITAMDSGRVEREVLLTWSKTDPIIGKAKADMMMLLTGCGVPVQYDEKATGIYYFGVPGSDVPIRDGLQQGQQVICGQILEYQRVEDIPAGILKLEMLCRPRAGRFSGDSRRYLMARNEPYEFTITENKEWSLFGKDVVLQKPVCNE